jgi:hypothetical protein
MASHNSHETKRDKRNSKKKTTRSKRESRRKRNNKKNSRRCQYKRNSSPDDKQDSSSSSSNASSASSSEYTVSSEDDSILAFASHKITNVTDIVSKKQQRQTSTRVGKEIKKLTAAAKVYDLRPFYTDRGTIEQRKTHFVHWANKLRDI